jgi:phage terminase small subunit
MARKSKKRSAPAQPRLKSSQPSLKDTLGFAADSAARSVVEQHPMMKKMRNDMHKALMSVARGARGPAARGRQKSLFS